MIQQFAESVKHNLLDHLTSCVEIIKIKMVVDNVLDFGMHVSDEFGFNNGLNESSSNLIDAALADFFVNHSFIAHLVETT